MLNSVKGVAHRVPDLRRAANWYGEILGKSPIFDSPIVVMFAVGESVLTLVPAAETPSRDEPQTIVYWEVDDIEAAHRHWLDAGAAPRSDIMTTAMQSKAATVIDPFGNVIPCRAGLFDPRASGDFRHGKEIPDPAVGRAGGKGAGVLRSGEGCGRRALV